MQITTSKPIVEIAAKDVRSGYFLPHPVSNLFSVEIDDKSPKSTSMQAAKKTK